MTWFTFILGFLAGQVFSGATLTLIHQIILHRRRTRIDVQRQLDEFGNPPQIPAMPPTAETAVSVDEERPLKMKTKTLGWIIFASAVAATSWGAIKWDIVLSKREISDHGDKLAAIDAKLAVIEIDARITREAITDAKWEQKLTGQRIESLTNVLNQKLDYLTGDKRGMRPASGPAPATP